MRDLTQQEIDNAPDWATDYVICDDGDVCFESEESFMYLNDGDLKGLVLDQDAAMSEDAKPIPRKNMEPYKHWCDAVYDGNGEHSHYDLIFRKKAIEIAKHFKLTAEDLK